MFVPPLATGSMDVPTASLSARSSEPVAHVVPPPVLLMILPSAPTLREVQGVVAPWQLTRPSADREPMVAVRLVVKKLPTVRAVDDA